MNVQRKRMQNLRRGDVIADGIAATGLWRVTKIRHRASTKSVRAEVTNIFDRTEKHIDGTFSDWREVLAA